jgi:hypothetical protein
LNFLAPDSLCTVPQTQNPKPMIVSSGLWSPCFLYQVRASPLFHTKLGAPNGIWWTLICPGSTYLAGPPPVLTILPLHKHGWPACHRTVHIPSGLWALLTLFLTKSSQILRKVGTARVLPDSGEWCLGARISGARLRNLGWCMYGGAQFEDRPQSSPCWASLAWKSGDALSTH